MSKFASTTDEVFKQELHYQNHTDVLTAKLTQPTEDIILERNAQLRKAPGSMRDLGQSEGKSKGTETWGRLLCTIPHIGFEQAIRDGYDLNSKDAKHAEKELHRFLQSDYGKMCLVN